MVGTGGKGAFSPGDAITFAWERIKADPGTILATLVVGLIICAVVSGIGTVIVNIVSGAAGAATKAAARGGVANPFDMLLGPVYFVSAGVVHLFEFVFFSFLGAGMWNFALKVARGAPYAFGDLFSGGPFFLSVLAANFIINLVVGIGLVLLIVPGVIVALGLSMTVPLIIDRRLGPIEALQQSWQLTDGNKGTLFIFSLIAIGLALAGTCACLVGVLLVAPLLMIAHTYIYLKLSGQPVAQAGPTV